MATLISSFYNEEYLLPWWLEHHKKMFDHGVLFNYFSTDRSVEIIKHICPDWEVRDTVNKDWDFRNNDIEFMSAEREFWGYKMVLTTTEFLEGNIEDLPEEPTCFAIPIFRLVDTEPGKPPHQTLPLMEQKKSGYWATKNKYRFLHNFIDGLYIEPGRHVTAHDTVKREGLVVKKCTFSPWTEEFIHRKLDMKTYLPQNQTSGKHHTWDRNKLEEEYRKELLKCQPKI